jgi:hypothetical protein
MIHPVKNIAFHFHEQNFCSRFTCPDIYLKRREYRAAYITNGNTIPDSINLADGELVLPTKLVYTSNGGQHG